MRVIDTDAAPPPDAIAARDSNTRREKLSRSGNGAGGDRSNVKHISWNTSARRHVGQQAQALLARFPRHSVPAAITAASVGRLVRRAGSGRASAYSGNHRGIVRRQVRTTMECLSRAGIGCAIRPVSFPCLGVEGAVAAHRDATRRTGDAHGHGTDSIQKECSTCQKRPAICRLVFIHSPCI